MKWKIATAIASAIAIGACGVAIVQAQTKAPAYFVALVNVKDQDGYSKEFLPKVLPMIKEGGGEYVAGGFNKTHSLSGAAPPNRVVIIRFDGGMSAVDAWYEKQKPILKEVGEKYASFQNFGVEGVEQK